MNDPQLWQSLPPWKSKERDIVLVRIFRDRSVQCWDGNRKQVHFGVDTRSRRPVSGARVAMLALPRIKPDAVVMELQHMHGFQPASFETIAHVVRKMREQERADTEFDARGGIAEAHGRGSKAPKRKTRKRKAKAQGEGLLGKFRERAGV